MLIVTGEAEAREGSFDALLAAARAHSARSRGEAGCMGHNCYTDPEAPNRVFFYERWRNRSSLDAHFNTAGVAELVAAFDRHAVRRGDLHIYLVSAG